MTELQHESLDLPTTDGALGTAIRPSRIVVRVEYPGGKSLSFTTGSYVAESSVALRPRVVEAWVADLFVSPVQPLHEFELRLACQTVHVTQSDSPAVSAECG